MLNNLYFEQAHGSHSHNKLNGLMAMMYYTSNIRFLVFDLATFLFSFCIVFDYGVSWLLYPCFESKSQKFLVKL